MLDSITMPAAHLLAALAALLTPIGGLPAAIVLLTLVGRAALHPLTRRAARGERARLRLAPKLAALRRKHAGNPTRLAVESMALYRSAGVSPLAGLMPVFAQAPVFIVLFHLFAGQAAGTVLGERLFTGQHVLVFLALLAGLTAIAWLTSRRTAMLMRANAPVAEPAMPAAASDPDASGLIARLPRILPYATVASALALPMALVIYLLTSTAWTLVENTVLRRGLLA
jgi:YidC/Oxa1 family membrane protein insertase